MNEDKPPIVVSFNPDVDAEESVIAKLRQLKRNQLLIVRLSSSKNARNRKTLTEAERHLACKDKNCSCERLASGICTCK